MHIEGSISAVQVIHGTNLNKWASGIEDNIKSTFYFFFAPDMAAAPMFALYSFFLKHATSAVNGAC
jgi:hypothetical protein